MTALADRELLDLLGEHPELLAVADALSVTQRPRRRIPRRVVATALVAAAALAVALVAPWQDRGPSVVDRALAAVGPGPVVHAVVEYSWPRDVIMNISTGQERQRVRRTEYWYDAERKELHTRLITDGMQITEIVETRTHAWSDIGDFPTQGFEPQLDPALAGFVTGYRKALASGEAKIVGDTRVDGRDAKVIRIPIVRGNAVEEVVVDAHSYAPIRFHATYPGQRRSPDWRVVTIESLQRDPSFFAHPAQSAPRPTGGSATEGREISLADAHGVLGRAPLWLGATFGNAKIESVQLGPVTAELTDGTKVDGSVVRITYANGARVSQAIDPAGAYALGMDDGGDPPAPPGSMAVTSDAAAAAAGTRPPSVHGGGHWQAELRLDGVWLTLDASSREQLLAAARALTPMPGP
ncbi:MAG: hypothetical protein QOE36_3574 [Gaiellaceae bacterium]|nr:hypothetical protein [Gaiellaceae bacterium]